MRQAHPLIFPCDICGNACKAGAGVHGYQKIAGYALTVCKSCFQNSHEGWARAHEEAFEMHLELKGIPLPPRNPNGWYPREPG